MKRSAVFSTLKYMILISMAALFSGAISPQFVRDKSTPRFGLDECSTHQNFSMDLCSDVIKDTHLDSSRDSFVTEVIEESEEEKIELLFELKLSRILRPFNLLKRNICGPSQKLSPRFLSFPLRC